MAWLSHHVDEATVAQGRYLRGRGCSRCGGLGFQGRRGVYEVLTISDELTAALQRGQAHEVTEMAYRQVGRRTLAYSAAELAMQGRTTVAEAMSIAE